MSKGFSGSCQRTELATSDRQEPSANPNTGFSAQTFSVDLARLYRNLEEAGIRKEWGLQQYRYPKSPKEAQNWAVDNWRKAINAKKIEGKSARTIKALKRRKVDDLHCMVEAFKTCAPSLTNLLVCKWKEFHPKWVADEVRSVCLQTEPAPRRHRYSLRSIRATLASEDQGTWEVYRKLMLRKSRSTSSRMRAPSRQKVALTTWALKESNFARLLQLLIVKNEPVRFVEFECGLVGGDIEENVGRALQSFRKALEGEATFDLKGPHQVSRIVSRDRGQLSRTTTPSDLTSKEVPFEQ